MTIAEWKQMRKPRGRWRRWARMVIRDVVDRCDGIQPPALLAAVDHAYPFGERQYQPYKDWLTERKIFRAALADAVSVPTADEAAACEVARDAVLEGCLDVARAALEQAPNRLARKCPACGALSGSPCFESRPMPGPHTTPFHGIDLSVAMLVPHHARLVGHLDAGPLFTTT